MNPGVTGLISDFVPVEVLGFGSVMLVLLALVHGAGLDWIVTRYRGRSQVLLDRGGGRPRAAFLFASAIFCLLVLHMIEICIWGLALNWSGLVPNLRNAMYFSANTYTTIGYGEMILPQTWRELSPIMAISGLFNFAWTTGQMFELVHDYHDLIEKLKTGPTEQPPALTPAEERLALRLEIEEKMRRLHEMEIKALGSPPPPA